MAEEIPLSLELRAGTSGARRAARRARGLLFARTCLPAEKSEAEVRSILGALMQPANLADDDSLSDFLHEVAYLVLALTRRGSALAAALAREAEIDPRALLEDMENDLPADRL